LRRYAAAYDATLDYFDADYFIITPLPYIIRHYYAIDAADAATTLLAQSASRRRLFTLADITPLRH